MRESENTASTAAIATLIEQLGKGKVSSSGPAYEAARKVWNCAVTQYPMVIVRCENSADVQAAVRTATQHGLSLSVRGGGHDWAGRAVAGELVVDLSRMRSVEVQGQEASVAGGATCMDVAEVAGRYGLAPVTSNLGAVGMTGLTLGGGYGPLTGQFGLASDNLLGAEVVTADGQLILTDELHAPDLLWALRGGGGNFGVVTSLRVRVHPVAELSAGTVAFPWEQAEKVAVAFGKFQAAAPDGLTLTPAFSPGPDGELALAMLYAWCGPASEDVRILETVKALGEPSNVKVARTSYVQMLKDTEALVVPNVSALYRTVTLGELQPGAINAIIQAMDVRSSPLSYIVLHPFHGAGKRIALESTAFGLRRGHFVVGIYAFWQDGAATAHQAWADAAEAALLPYALPSAYPNYFGPDRPQQAAQAYGLNAERLLRLKEQYDPSNLFNAISLPPHRAETPLA